MTKKLLEDILLSVVFLLRLDQTTDQDSSLR